MKSSFFWSFIIFLIVSCEQNHSSVTESIIKKLDSLGRIGSCHEPDCSIAKKLEKNLADSLYNIDSTNYSAIIAKLFLLQEDHKFKESMIFCNKVLSHDSINYMHRFTSLLFMGWYLESVNNLDSSKTYYRQMIPLFSKVDLAPWLKPQITNILNGRTAGYNALKESGIDSTALYYQYVLNDIENYNNDGLRGCFPLYDNGVKISQFSIYIPEHIYKDSLNSMERVSFYFTNQGVNIQATGHYSSERKFTIQTLPKYVDKLLKIIPFKIEVSEY